MGAVRERAAQPWTSSPETGAAASAGLGGVCTSGANNRGFTPGGHRVHIGVAGATSIHTKAVSEGIRGPAAALPRNPGAAAGSDAPVFVEPINTGRSRGKREFQGQATEPLSPMVSRIKLEIPNIVVISRNSVDPQELPKPFGPPKTFGPQNPFN